MALRGELEEHQVKTFHSLVLQGKIRIAVWWITEREKGSVVQLDDAFSKTRKTFPDMLWSKHPEDRVPLAISIDAYPG